MRFLHVSLKAEKQGVTPVFCQRKREGIVSVTGKRKFYVAEMKQLA